MDICVDVETDRQIDICTEGETGETGMYICLNRQVYGLACKRSNRQTDRHTYVQME